VRVYASPEVAERIEAAVKRADEAFWAEVAAAFPEANTGDLSVEETLDLTVAERKVIGSWLRWNSDLVVEL
jgi:hypothetical protein